MFVSFSTFVSPVSVFARSCFCIYRNWRGVFSCPFLWGSCFHAVSTHFYPIFNLCRICVTIICSCVMLIHLLIANYTCYRSCQHTWYASEQYIDLHTCILLCDDFVYAILKNIRSCNPNLVIPLCPHFSFLFKILVFSKGPVYAKKNRNRNERFYPFPSIFTPSQIVQISWLF